MTGPTRFRWGFLVALLVAATAGAACDANPPAPVPAPPEQTIDRTPVASVGAPSERDWPTYHQNNARTGVAPGFAPPTQLAVGWTAALDGAVYGQPLVIGDVVYAAT